MYDDPIVADIRRLRDEYARCFGYDLEAICRDLREQQQRGGRRVVRRQPKRPSSQHTLAVPKVTEQCDEPDELTPS
jgi:hypothetical protein